MLINQCKFNVIQSHPLFTYTSGKEILKSVLGRSWQNYVESPECSSRSDGTDPRKAKLS